MSEPPGGVPIRRDGTSGLSVAQALVEANSRGEARSGAGSGPRRDLRRGDPRGHLDESEHLPVVQVSRAHKADV